ncbi:MAG: type II toxin-antitoxin system Phd/YefM family antitoxin [Dehalococcoidia bacterium]
MRAYNGAMVAVTISDVERDLPGYLKRVEAGETVVVLRDGRPIAEIRPVAEGSQQFRPYGLGAGEFTTPDDFDEPLPDDIIAASVPPGQSRGHPSQPRRGSGWRRPSWMSHGDDSA